MGGVAPAPDDDDTYDLESGQEKARLQDVKLPDTVTQAPVTAQPYDPTPVMDHARKWIGYTLLALLTLIVGCGFLALFMINGQPIDSSTSTIQASDAKADGERLISLLNIVFGPVVTLLGSVTGFYFGTQSVRTAASAAPSSPTNRNG